MKFKEPKIKLSSRGSFHDLSKNLAKTTDIAPDNNKKTEFEKKLFENLRFKTEKPKSVDKSKLNYTATQSLMKKKQSQQNESYFKDLFDDNYLKENDLEINKKIKSLIPEVKTMKSEM